MCLGRRLMYVQSDAKHFSLTGPICVHLRIARCRLIFDLLNLNLKKCDRNNYLKRIRNITKGDLLLEILYYCHRGGHNFSDFVENVSIRVLIHAENVDIDWYDNNRDYDGVFWCLMRFELGYTKYELKRSSDGDEYWSESFWVFFWVFFEVFWIFLNQNWRRSTDTYFGALYFSLNPTIALGDVREK